MRGIFGVHICGPVHSISESKENDLMITETDEGAQKRFRKHELLYMVSLLEKTNDTIVKTVSENRTVRREPAFRVRKRRF